MSFQENMASKVADLKNSRNSKTIVDLILTARKCEESVFQKDPNYLKFKAQKNITTSDIKLFVGNLHDHYYPEEKIYWNKRALDGKVNDKGHRYVFLYNLICVYSELKEYELVFEYGHKQLDWSGSLKKETFRLVFTTEMIVFMMHSLLEACVELKRFEESIIYLNVRMNKMPG